MLKFRLEVWEPVLLLELQEQMVTEQIEHKKGVVTIGSLSLPGLQYLARKADVQNKQMKTLLLRLLKD